jgi:hypothetical protein
MRRKKFVQLNSWVLFLGIVTVAYLGRFNKIASIDYNTLWVKERTLPMEGKRILVLDDMPDLYTRNHLATPFLNWKLSREIFRNPDYYENVTQVYHAFMTDPPDVVIDRENLLAAFLERMPEIKSVYQRQGDQYVRRANN